MEVKTYIENFPVNYSTSPVRVSSYPAPPTNGSCPMLAPCASRSAVTLHCCCYILSRRFSLCFLHLNTKHPEVHFYDPSSDLVLTTPVTAITHSRKLSRYTEIRTLGHGTCTECKGQTYLILVVEVRYWHTKYLNISH